MISLSGNAHLNFVSEILENPPEECCQDTKGGQEGKAASCQFPRSLVGAGFPDVNSPVLFTGGVHILPVAWDACCSP